MILSFVLSLSLINFVSASIGHRSKTEGKVSQKPPTLQQKKSTSSGFGQPYDYEIRGILFKSGEHVYRRLQVNDRRSAIMGYHYHKARYNVPRFQVVFLPEYTSGELRHRRRQGTGRTDSPHSRHRYQALKAK